MTDQRSLMDLAIEHRRAVGMPIDVLDVGCPECSATYVRGELHECPRVCGLCERRADDLIERPGGLFVCGACRRLERARYEQATGRCARGCEIAPAFHPDPDVCPEELEVRRLEGNR